MYILTLTNEEKEEWVKRDYNIGRFYALSIILGKPQLKDDATLHELCMSLLDYDHFGSGDEYENELWRTIIDHLGLEEYYDKFWE